MFEVGGDGRASDAETLLKGIGARKPGQFQGYCDQIQIRGIYGDTAVLTDRRVLKGTAANGQSIDAAWRVTRVLVKQNGKWRAAASALTAIPQSNKQLPCVSYAQPCVAAAAAYFEYVFDKRLRELVTVKVPFSCADTVMKFPSSFSPRLGMNSSATLWSLPPSTA